MNRGRVKSRRGRLLGILAGLGLLIGLGGYLAHLLGSPFPDNPVPMAVPQLSETSPSGEQPAVQGHSVQEPSGSELLFPGPYEPGQRPLDSDERRVNILLLGIDSREEGEQSRSDTLILISLAPQTRELSLLSIPRDSRVKIPGHGWDKINHAHAFGGIPLSLQTVADALKVPVHHYVRIEMPNFLKVVDLVGPVLVDVPYPLTLADGSQLAAGEVSMGSELALAYLRERYSDPGGDLGRSERAQGFLIDLARQAKGRISLSDLPRLYALFVRHVDTDLDLRESLSLVRLLWAIDLDQAGRGRLQGEGREIDGIYYYEVDWTEAERQLRELGIR